MDVIGDDTSQEKKKKKKSGQKKKDEPKKKQWTREQILSTFLPPEKQVKGRKTVSKKREKKSFPQAVMKSPDEPKIDPSEDTGNCYDFIQHIEKNKVIKETMQSIHMDHVPAWARSRLGYPHDT